MAFFTFATRLALLTFFYHVNANPLIKPNQQTLQCATGTFSNVVVGTGVSIVIETATPVPANGSFAESALADKGFPGAFGLPKLCAVIVNVTNTSAVPQSNYRLGLFLPDTWNSKVLTVGGSSFAGGINWPALSEGAHYQMATISTDNGHNSIISDLSWANPSTLLDWGYRALHGSVEVGKLMTAAYYGQSSTRSYYSGCSTGGRQGLKEIQISPDSFHGALIGAPAWDTKYLMPWITKIGVDVLNGTGTFGQNEMDFLAVEILAQCDGIDGHNDSIVSWPEQCTPDFNAFLCPGAAPSSKTVTCLTAGQIAIAKQIYSDYTTSNGTFVHNGFELSSENQWGTYVDDTTPSTFDVAYEQYFLYNDPTWSWQQFSDKVSYDSINQDPGQATADQYNISEFEARGGKILMYHGLADGLVPTKSSELYYSNTKDATEHVKLLCSIAEHKIGRKGIAEIDCSTIIYYNNKINKRKIETTLPKFRCLPKVKLVLCHRVRVVVARKLRWQ
ncbi:tannase-domain-containing protein [Hyaloscypha variabilis F]|uniref:Carboxylic ester hydrolase n=1 Tax=Hyaloscypha variabilis (strain UAMH 11265 / GT02V1 / F) TaxID=1149755 RepID=A0A2J6QTK3_HYAVF|nr:tannase-domain-containing protein [Hyaloscypha variabilis F]